ncbi:MAG: helix-turn-helix domain-containing protein [Lachnospiraceae bacterium]|nr:helix-turn-helix domain-containing protein [Lachnospiraceae bacterium]
MEALDLLEKLNRETGISFSLTEDELENPNIISRLQQLLSSVHGHNDRDFFFQQFLLGQLSAEEITSGRLKFHIEKTTNRALFLIAFKSPFDDMSLSVLSSLETGNDILVEMDQHHIVLIRQCRGPLGEEDLYKSAASIVDALSTEAMQAVRISYDRMVTEFEQLVLSYKHAEVALHLGVTFKNGKQIHSYHDLGLEKLLYRISTEDAKEYLEENLPSFDFSTLDNEMRSTIKVLFNNQLNIAETAKELFIHRNTLIYRLDKFQKMTGLDLRNFDDAIICKVAMILAEYTK